MKRQNKSKYALLGILNMRPMTGYTIKKTIAESLGNFWNESYGQIYPNLRELVADGWATISIEEQTGKPDRHVYTLTAAGRAEYQKWLATPGEFEEGRNEVLLKLFFGSDRSVAVNLAQVQEFQALQQQFLQKFGGIADWLKAQHTGNPALPYWLMTVSYGQHVSRALIDWTEETLGILDQLAQEKEGAGGLQKD